MISLNNINKYYKQGSQQVHILHDISLDIEQGEFVGIMGQSGSGKSTLINIIGFLDREYQGNYIFKGEKVSNYSNKKLTGLRNKNVGFVFQNFKLIKNLTVAENVALPLIYAGVKKKEITRKITEVLEKVGLAGYEKSIPAQLSGGQQQRVSIARAIIGNPTFLIADEPTGALDSKTSEEIMNLFKELNVVNNTTIIIVTHDPTVGQQMDRLLTILDGRLTSDTGADNNEV
ncbi:MAG: ABC transporter ATP-binding protein [Liquorilactobacillus hordei]|uniref:ABC transporter-like protein n=2 Tax=Liquorilactobacillus hordei TaxID=468911 RepID=A0A0R1MKR8_9LACO|nr:ABC transporter ATP-binding protein [Liquorilactobacillus hordei]AUJ29125.1 peptide ABC transporter ATP-binding protein [Liquorilactobacillus hordei]KRL08089.1 ABC transporter-like protein [Liquorilactobacillus hordei DSM 19519]MBZ2406540.1 ABC transporter ATP-binding protein [Liquorilactobacillus hordei]QYH53105.1 ABC transporter ATP-binding protein [Liquorilactobacillus hordei DSM 19519]